MTPSPLDAAERILTIPAVLPEMLISWLREAIVAAAQPAIARCAKHSTDPLYATTDPDAYAALAAWIDRLPDALLGEVA